MAKKQNRKSGIVYSTNSDFDYAQDEEEFEESVLPSKQNLRISLQRLKGNKKLTRIYNFVGPDEDIQDLGKELKRKCGCGGSVKNREVLLQGDFVDKIKTELSTMGYAYKQVGG